MKKLADYKACGMNADWSCDAWFVYSAVSEQPNEFGTSVYILDLEDGNHAIAVRNLSDDYDDIEVPFTGLLDECLIVTDELEAASWVQSEASGDAAVRVLSLLENTN